MIGEYVLDLCRRSTINFVENPETVFENLREIAAAPCSSAVPQGLGEDLFRRCSSR
jgi:hypothetical protein